MMPVPSYIPIENNPTLARDTKSMGVVSTDHQAQIRYRIQKERILSEKKLLVSALGEIDRLREDFNGLKEMVQKYITA
jgi:hypothetical protein